MSGEKEEHEDMSGYITKFGRYHVFFFVICFVPSIMAGIQALHGSFTNALPPTRCCVPELEACDVAHRKVYNATFFASSFDKQWFYEAPGQEGMFCAYCPKGNSTGNNTCTEGTSRACDHGFVYDTSTYKTSVSIEFDLSCGDGWKHEFVPTMYMIGLLFGGGISGFFSDRFGRRPAFLVGAFGSILSFAALPLSPSFPIYCLLTIFTAFFGNVCYLTAFVVLMEVMSGKWRTICGMLVQAYFSMAYLWIGVSAMYVKQWQSLYWIASAPALAYLGYYWLFPESIRWLISKGRTEEAENAIKRIARINRVTIPDSVLQRGLTEREVETGAEDTEEKTESVLQIIHHWPLLKMTLIVFYTWMVASMSYYGLSLNTGDLPGSVYTNIIISGMVEIPGYFISIPMLEYWGRKPSLVLMWFISGLGCIAAGLIPAGYEALTVTCAMIGKICVAAAFAVVYNYTSELFPTTIRHTITGLASLMSRIGGVAAPQIHLLAQYGPNWVPIVIYGAFALSAAGLNLLLPETRNKAMPETIADGVRFARGEAPDLDSSPDLEAVPMEPVKEEKPKF